EVATVIFAFLGHCSWDVNETPAARVWFCRPRPLAICASGSPVQAHLRGRNPEQIGAQLGSLLVQMRRPHRALETGLEQIREYTSAAHAGMKLRIVVG